MTSLLTDSTVLLHACHDHIFKIFTTRRIKLIYPWLSTQGLGPLPTVIQCWDPLHILYLRNFQMYKRNVLFHPTWLSYSLIPCDLNHSSHVRTNLVTTVDNVYRVCWLHFRGGYWGTQRAHIWFSYMLTGIITSQQFSCSLMGACQSSHPFLLSELVYFPLSLWITITIIPTNLLHFTFSMSRPVMTPWLGRHRLYRRTLTLTLWLCSWASANHHTCPYRRAWATINLSQSTIVKECLSTLRPL
jgi:hypothetical protein